jgi:hypothetical protein
MGWWNSAEGVPRWSEYHDTLLANTYRECAKTFVMLEEYGEATMEMMEVRPVLFFKAYVRDLHICSNMSHSLVYWW